MRHPLFLVGFKSRNIGPMAHHRDPIADRKNIIHIMANVNHCFTLGFELFDHIKDLLSLGYT